MGTTSQKKRCTLGTILFLFMLSIFVFSKRALEPSLSFYRDLYFSTPHLPRTDSHHSSPEFTPHPTSISNSHSNPKTVEAILEYPISPPSLSAFVVDSEFEDTSKGTKSVDSWVENKNYLVPRNESFGTVVANGSGDDVFREKLKWDKHCNLYLGTWVKAEEYPIYKPGSCPYVDEAFDCQSNGRRDSEYLKWRWKPDGCDLPRWLVGCYPILGFLSFVQMFVDTLGLTLIWAVIVLMN